MVRLLLRLPFFMAFAHQSLAWNPSSFPFLPASTDTSNIRDIIIGAQGSNKRILDLGCGNGYSTAISEGSVGIDEELNNIKSARRQFPDKTFKLGVLSSVTPSDTFDVVTCMFYFHRTPQFIRKMIIANAIKIANERVIVVDISPDYSAGYEMYKQSKFLEDYYANCRNDLLKFTETKLMDGMLSIWVYDVPTVYGECPCSEIDNPV